MTELRPPEPRLSHRLFAKRAMMIAGHAANWASCTLELPEDTDKPVSAETAARFARDIRGIVDIIVRDAKAND